MAQDYTQDCYNSAHLVDTDQSNVEKNFEVLRTKFSGTSAPSPTIAGQWWADTFAAEAMLKIRDRANSSWLNVYNYTTGEVYILPTMRQGSIVAGESISPSSCSLKTSDQIGGSLPVNYRVSPASGYSFSVSSESDIAGMATQVNVKGGQILVARAELQTGAVTGYVRFAIGAITSNEVSVSSGTTAWTATMTAVVSGTGWQTLKWRGRNSVTGTTTYVLANAVCLG